MIDYPTQFHGPAQDMGMRFLRLEPSSKSAAGGSWEGSVLQNPEEIQDAFDKGFNVGFLLVSKGGANANPLGVWGLDIDSKAAFDRYDDAPFTVMVSRGHEFKRHLLARLPDPLKPRHSRLVRGSHDVKLTGILVAPGSRHKDGGNYSVFVRDAQTREWVPWDGTPIDWANLPVVDPTAYMPSSTKLIYLSSQEASKAALSNPTEWIFKEVSTPAGWRNRPYATAAGDLTTRKIRADAYIRNRIQYGIVSHAGDGGRATLLTTVIHLVQYLKLPDEMVLDKLTAPVHGAKKAWNDLCVDSTTGKPYLWTDAELDAAIHAAHSYVPYFGVSEYERLKRREMVDERLWHFFVLLGHLPPPEDDAPAMKAQDLYTTFLEMYNVKEEDCSYRLFVLGFQKAVRSRTIPFKTVLRTRRKLTHYLGVSPGLIDFALELQALDGAGAA